MNPRSISKLGAFGHFPLPFAMSTGTQSRIVKDESDKLHVRKTCPKLVGISMVKS